MRIGLWDWDIDANTVVCSDETYRQWGFTPEAFSSRVEDAMTCIHHDDRARVALAVARVLSGDAKEFAEQYRIVRQDGSTCWLDAHGVILQDEGLHMMGVGVDITGLKTIQRLLEESEERYLLLLNSTAEAIYGLDLNGICTFCNPACLRLLGYEKPADLLGKNMHQLTHHTRPDGTPYPAEECVIYRAIREGVPSHQSHEVLWRADGSRFFVEYWSHPMFRNGEPVGAVVAFLDITERKAAEKALQSLSSRLLEVQETERHHLALELHDEIGQLLTGLRLLLGHNEELSADALESRLEQARAIVDDLISQVRSLSFELRPADLDQLGVVPALLALFERYTAQTGVLVNFKHQGMERRLPSPIETSAYRVVQEALTNAARHACVAGVTVRVWMEAGKLNLQIEDRGKGFDPEVVLKAPHSSGLIGMRERIVLLGGRMNLESSPGAGTTITAELPTDQPAEV